MRKILQLHLRRMLLVAMVAVGMTMPLVAQTFTANRLNYSISNGEATIVSFVKGEKIDTLRIPRRHRIQQCQLSGCGYC